MSSGVPNVAIQMAIINNTTFQSMFRRWRAKKCKFHLAVGDTSKPVPNLLIAGVQTLQTVADLNSMQEMLSSKPDIGVINSAKTHLVFDLDPGAVTVATNAYPRRVKDHISTNNGIQLGWMYLRGLDNLYLSGTTAALWYWVEAELELIDPIYAV